VLALRKALGILVSLIALAGLLVTVVLATRRVDQRPRTDDAYLQADLVHMAPDVSGRIVELDESVPKHCLTSWFSDRIHRLYDLANAE
jgi:multidrug resistance efflux pump